MTIPQSRKRRGKLLIGLLVAGLVVVLTGLGIWQVQRLGWKTDLIERVETRLASAASDAPGPSVWPALDQKADEYTRVTVTGEYLPGSDALVMAVTEHGGGYWVMSPLRTSDGWILWINRGFVPQDHSTPADRPLPGGEQQISGLLRMSQPGGAFLRSNDPAGDRWYSRDVAALSASRGIDEAAPYFIDAARGNRDALPIGGLTVVTFRNAHLSYAITWFALAVGLAVASFIFLRREWRG